MDRDVVRVDEVETGHADEHAARELAEDRGLAEALGDLAEGFGGDEDRDEGEEELRDVHGGRGYQCRAGFSPPTGEAG